jgi:hypothetical protein
MKPSTYLQRAEGLRGLCLIAYSKGFYSKSGRDTKYGLARLYVFEKTASRPPAAFDAGGLNLGLQNKDILKS